MGKTRAIVFIIAIVWVVSTLFFVWADDCGVMCASGHKCTCTVSSFFLTFNAFALPAWVLFFIAASMKGEPKNPYEY